MSLSQLLLTLLTVLCLAAGQILFKISAQGLDFANKGLIENFVSPKLIAALVVYGFATILWLVVLKVTPLRLAYPFVALAFVIVPVAAYWLLGEPLKWNTIAGAGLILLGVCLSAWS